MIVREALWVVEVVSDDGAEQVFHYVSIIELRDGKVFRDTRYYAQSFEAREWRTQWVERMKY